MNKRLQALLQRKQAAVEKMREVRAAAGDNLFTEEQTTAFEAAKAEAVTLEANIAQEREAIEIERSAAATGTAVDIGAASVEVGVDRRTLDATHGFAHFGQYLAAVRGAAVAPSSLDQRLLIGAAASTYANESVGADGGYLVPPQYARDILAVITDNEPLLARTRNIPVSGNKLIIPVSEETKHGTTGVQAYWDAEAATMTASKPVFQNREISLNRLTALVPVTEESLEDSAAMGSWISMLSGEKMAFKVTDAIMNGGGAGQPLGIVPAPGTVSVAKETSQVAATIVAENVLKMYSRMPSASIPRAVWLIHSDAMVQLAQLNIKIKNVAGSENVGGIPVSFTLPSALTGDMPMLMGRPVIAVESAAALGTVGDIVFADLSNYISVTKGGVKADESMHFYFDQNIRTFRFVMRMGGQPWLSTPITRKNGSSTLSHFVTLATRA